MRAREFISEAPPALAVPPVAPAAATVQQRLQDERKDDQAARQRDVDFINKNNTTDKEKYNMQRQQSYQNYAQDQQQDAASDANYSQMMAQQKATRDQQVNQALQSTAQQDSQEAANRQQTRIDRNTVGKQLAVAASAIPSKQQIQPGKSGSQPAAPGTPVASNSPYSQAVAEVKKK